MTAGGGASVGSELQPQAPSPVFFSCLFAHNTSENGGGLFGSLTSAPEVTNCTFTQNSSLTEGAAIRHSNAIGQQGPNKSLSVRIQNSILWNNQSGGATGELAQLFGAATLDHSSLQGLADGSNYWPHSTASGSFDPLFVDPDDDFHLTGGGSLVIDGGSTTTALGFFDIFDLDQDGSDSGTTRPRYQGQNHRRWPDVRGRYGQLRMAGPLRLLRRHQRR